MYYFRLESYAREQARQDGKLYGLSAFRHASDPDGKFDAWYTGTEQELRNAGVSDVLSPSAP